MDNGHGRLDVRPDAEGRRSLFSTEPSVPASGSVVVTCSRCGEDSVLGLGAAARAMVPSLHLLVVKRRFPSLVKCPACKRFSWVNLRVVV
jgi:hypothetical protein